ncbi:hypothetical protein MTO96_005021 [Rhipicephalus appendiculatus]
MLYSSLWRGRRQGQFVFIVSSSSCSTRSYGIVVVKVTSPVSCRQVQHFVMVSSSRSILPYRVVKFDSSLWHRIQGQFACIVPSSWTLRYGVVVKVNSAVWCRHVRFFVMASFACIVSSSSRSTRRCSVVVVVVVVRVISSSLSCRS